MNQQTIGKPQPPDDSWLTVDFFENCQNFPADELMKYSANILRRAGTARKSSPARMMLRVCTKQSKHWA